MRSFWYGRSSQNHATGAIAAAAPAAAANHHHDRPARYRPNTPLAARCTIPITVEVPDDPAVRVGTEAYLAGALLIEVLMVGIGLRLGPMAIDRLQRVHAVLSEHGIDSEVHPALKWGWSKAERGATDHE